MSHPWERQPGETDAAFAAFRQYLLLDTFDRSIRTACTNPGRIAQWERWSAKYRWVRRVAAWEDHLFVEELKARERARRRLTLKSIEADEQAFHEAVTQGKHLHARICELLENGALQTITVRTKLPSGEVRTERQRSVIPDLCAAIDRWIDLRSVAALGLPEPPRSLIAKLKSQTCPNTEANGKEHSAA